MKKLALLATTSVLALGIATFNNVRASDAEDSQSVKSMLGTTQLKPEQYQIVIDQAMTGLQTQKDKIETLQGELESAGKALVVSENQRSKLDIALKAKFTETTQFEDSSVKLATFNKLRRAEKDEALKKVEELEKKNEDLKNKAAQQSKNSREVEVLLVKFQTLVKDMNRKVQSAGNLATLKESIANLSESVQPPKIAPATPNSFVNAQLSANQGNNTTTTTTKIQVQGDGGTVDKRGWAGL